MRRNPSGLDESSTVRHHQASDVLPKRPENAVQDDEKRRAAVIKAARAMRKNGMSWSHIAAKLGIKRRDLARMANGRLDKLTG